MQQIEAGPQLEQPGAEQGLVVHHLGFAVELLAEEAKGLLPGAVEQFDLPVDALGMEGYLGDIDTAVVPLPASLEEVEAIERQRVPIGDLGPSYRK